MFALNADLHFVLKRNFFKTTIETLTLVLDIKGECTLLTVHLVQCTVL